MQHEIRFPRYAEDVLTKKRTLFHMPTGAFAVGDGLSLCAAPNFPRAAAAVITKVDQARLCDLTAEDLVLLNVADAAFYLASWDTLYPELPSNSNPLVYRIEFRYGWPTDDGKPDPEWCLAG